MSRAPSPLASRFFRLASINIVSNITTPLAGIVDIAFLGHLADVKHLAGVALASVLFDYLYWSFGFLRMATTGLTAQAVGRGDRREVLLVGVRNGAIAIAVGCAICLLQVPVRELGFWLLQGEAGVEQVGRAYFDSRVWGAVPSLMNFVLMGWFLGRERSDRVLVVTIAGNGTNVLLNYYFITQLGWGAFGAGLATTLSQYVMVGVGLAFAFPHLRCIRWRLAPSSLLQRSAFAKAFQLNADLLVRTFALMTTFALFTNIGSMMDTSILAANALLLQVFVLGVFFTDGFAFATESLAGIFDGQGNGDSLRLLLRLSMVANQVAGVTISVAFMLFPMPLLGILTDKGETINLALKYVPWLLPVLGFGALAFTLDGYFLGLTAGAMLRRSTILGTCVGFLPFAAIAVQLQEPHALWLGLSMSMLVRAAVLLKALSRPNDGLIQSDSATEGCSL